MDQDLCANCSHWREEHYDRSGAFVADKKFNCGSYQGSVPSPARRAKKIEQLGKALGIGAEGGAPEPKY